MKDMIYTQDGFIAVGMVNRDYGRSGPNHYAQLYISTDGIAWAIIVPPVKQWLLGIVHGKDSCIIVGTSGTILQSDHVAISMPWIPYLLLDE